MEPFLRKKQKKNIQLSKSKFNLADVFEKISRGSPTKAYQKLKQMCDKKSVTLHAFVELGILPQIKLWLKAYCNNNDEYHCREWLVLLNNSEFPVDWDIICDIKFAGFIKKDIAGKFKGLNVLCINLVNKWIEYGRKDKIRQNRHRRVKFGNADKLENRVFFRRRDRPIDISRNLRRINGNMHYNYTKKSVIKGIIKKNLSFGSKKVITIEEENSPKSDNEMEIEVKMLDDNFSDDNNSEDHDKPIIFNSNNNSENTDDDTSNDDNMLLINTDTKSGQKRKSDTKQTRPKKRQKLNNNSNNSSNEFKEHIQWYTPEEYEYRAEYKKIDDRITESCRIETERQRRLPEKTYLSIQVVPDNPTELESSKITANMKQSNPEEININYKHWDTVTEAIKFKDNNNHHTSSDYAETNPVAALMDSLFS